MGYNPSLNSQVTITANTNDWLDLWDEDAGNQSVQIDPATYNEPLAALTNLQGKIQALGGNWASATCTIIFTGSVPGMVTINSGQASKAVSILWSTGAHGSAGTDTHCGDVLGFSDGSDDTSAYTYTSDYQHQYAWYGLRAPLRYGPWKREEIGGEPVINLSSKNMKVVHVGYRRHYEVRLIELVPEITFAAQATGTNVNRDLETEWQRAVQGDWFRWREDQTDGGTYYDCYLLEPRNWFGPVERPHIDYHSYNLSMRFIRKES